MQSFLHFLPEKISLFFGEFHTQQADVVILLCAVGELVHSGQGDINHFADALGLALLQEIHNPGDSDFIAFLIPGFGETIGEKHELHAVLQPDFAFAEMCFFQQSQCRGAGNDRLERFAF